jgi:hypothetical protein
MTKIPRVVALAAALVAVTVPAIAVYNENITGHVVYVSQSTPGAGYVAETVRFKLDNMPVSPCITGGFMEFAISPSSVSDAQSRKNFLTMLLTAKATGATVTVAYDKFPGGFCDQGSYGIYYIVLN